MIDSYRKWYKRVEDLFEGIGMSTHDSIFTYVTAYSRFVSEGDAKKKDKLQKIYKEIESGMTSADIRLCRALVMGWHASDVLSARRSPLDSDLIDKLKGGGKDSKTTLYKSELKQQFEHEAENANELRKMLVGRNRTIEPFPRVLMWCVFFLACRIRRYQVDISADWITIHLPCFHLDGPNSAAARKRRRTTLHIYGCEMHVTEPLVSMSQPFDKPRCVKLTLSIKVE
jgi:hypothetical protein